MSCPTFRGLVRPTGPTTRSTARRPQATNGRARPRLCRITLCVALWCALGTALPPAVSARLDSFLCQAANNAVKGTKPSASPLHLGDRFQSADFALDAPRAFCAPVGELGESIVDRRTHLFASGLRPMARGKRPLGSFMVMDRFGAMDLVVVAPNRLLAPAASCTSDAECLAPDPRDHVVDNYECYAVKAAAKFQRKLNVRIVGASGALTVYDLKRPTRLCTPVDVNDQPMQAPQTYLTCYQAVRVKKVCAPAAPLHASAACKREEDCGGVKKQTTYCQRQPSAGSVADQGIASQLGTRQLLVKGKEELCVPPGSGALSANIGPDGGTLGLGRFEVVVPLNVLAESVGIAVHELPSQAEEAANDLDPAWFKPIGPAYAFEAPFLSDELLTLSLGWEEAEIPAGFAIENLGVLLHEDTPFVEDPSGGDIAGPWPRVLFVPAVGTVDPTAHRVHLGIPGRGTFQVVAMAGPIPAFEEPSAGSVARRVAAAPVTPRRFRVEYPDPSIQPEREFADRLVLGLEAAYQKLVVERGFPAPTAQVVVKVRRILAGSGLEAGVVASNPLVILVDPNLYLNHDVAAAMAHEYFHVIQFWNSNAASTAGTEGGGMEVNRWFFEGSAGWAAEEVYPRSHEYDAPDGDFFLTPLNARTRRGQRHAYQSVVFWKWLESRTQNAIRDLVLDHRQRTHTTLSPARVQNDVLVSIVDSLPALSPNARKFLDFATAALFWKDFDQDETAPGELWAANRLGPPKQLPATITDPAAPLRRGGPGDGESNKVRRDYLYRPHLTADVRVITNAQGADALSGTLHLDFDVIPNPEIKVAVIATDTEAETDLLDLPALSTVLEPFGAQTKVIVIAVDPQWLAPVVEAAGKQSFTAWVEASCPTGLTKCAGACTDTRTDPNNCGTCGRSCTAGQWCDNGTCTCIFGGGLCGGRCVDKQTDPRNCGACGNICNRSLVCHEGQCTAGACPTGEPSVWVSTDQELAAAAKVPGSVIGVEPGYYSGLDWVTLQDVTLVGDGSSFLPSIQSALNVRGNVTLRNLELGVPYGSYLIYACANLCLSFVRTTTAGISAEGCSYAGGVPLPILRIDHSEILGPGLENTHRADPVGITLGPAVSTEISSTNVTGWQNGLLWYFSEAFNTTLSVDCEGFYYNFYNARKVTTWPIQETVELCPDKLRPTSTPEPTPEPTPEAP